MSLGQFIQIIFASSPIFVLCAACSSSSNDSLNTSTEHELVVSSEIAASGYAGVSGTALPAYRLHDVSVDNGNDGSIDEVYQLRYSDKGLSIGELIDGDGDGIFESSFTYRYVDKRLSQTSYDQGRNGIVEVERHFAYDLNGILRTIEILAQVPGRVDQSIGYSLDELGRIASSRYDEDASSTQSKVTHYSYSYDQYNRVTYVDQENQSDRGTRQRVSYIYDESGVVQRRELDSNLDGIADDIWFYRYDNALCDASSNHQPLNHVCVFPVPVNH